MNTNIDFTDLLKSIIANLSLKNQIKAIQAELSLSIDEISKKYSISKTVLRSVINILMKPKKHRDDLEQTAHLVNNLQNISNELSNK